ncbi:MAG: hypothetical protein Q9217_000071 [Psora testacea]
MRIEVSPYDPAWPKHFADIKATLEAALNHVQIVAIEHVGSTSVPDLPAKPIIDIDIIVTRNNLPAVITALTTPVVGGEYKGEWGIPGRHAFCAPHLLPARNLYVCVEGCLALRNHLSVRDVLRVDEGLRVEYGDLKLKLAEREWADDDIGAQGYTRAKNEVLGRILEKAGLAEWERKEIEEVQ